MEAVAKAQNANDAPRKKPNMCFTGVHPQARLRASVFGIPAYPVGLSFEFGESGLCGLT
jgi:hypothetical protein